VPTHLLDEQREVRAQVELDHWRDGHTLASVASFKYGTHTWQPGGPGLSDANTLSAPVTRCRAQRPRCCKRACVWVTLSGVKHHVTLSATPTAAPSILQTSDCACVLCSSDKCADVREIKTADLCGGLNAYERTRSDKDGARVTG
jgi:hypothetical protein